MNNKITFNQKTYTSANSFYELEEKQFIAYAAVLLKKLKMREAIALMVKVLYNIPEDEFFKLKNFQIAQIGDTISWLFQHHNNTCWVIKKISIKQKLGVKKIKLYGPANRLANLLIKELRYTELYYNAYIKTNDVNYLNQLIATLYRPKASGILDTDVRIPVAEHDINQRAKVVASLPKKKKHAILINYESCRYFIFQKFPLVFPKQKSDGLAGPSKSIFDYNSIILSVAGGKFGTMKETENTKVYDFFTHLEEHLEQSEKLKSKA